MSLVPISAASLTADFNSRTKSLVLTANGTTGVTVTNPSFVKVAQTTPRKYRLQGTWSGDPSPDNFTARSPTLNFSSPPEPIPAAEVDANSQPKFTKVVIVFAEQKSSPQAREREISITVDGKPISTAIAGAAPQAWQLTAIPSNATKLQPIQSQLPVGDFYVRVTAPITILTGEDALSAGRTETSVEGVADKSLRVSRSGYLYDGTMFWDVQWEPITPLPSSAIFSVNTTMIPRGRGTTVTTVTVQPYVMVPPSA